MSKVEAAIPQANNTDGSPIEFVDSLKSPWDNVYWFARALINTDAYGAPGRDNALMIQVATIIRLFLDKFKGRSEDEVVADLMDAVREAIVTSSREGTKVRTRKQQLCEYLADNLLTIQDFRVLSLTCEKVMVPINHALENIPADDKVFSESIVKSLLRTRGKNALADIIQVWDDLGAYGSMTAERVQIIQAFEILRNALSNGFSFREQNLILTAFCQEFERRVGQKRKGRAGGAVESVTTVILDHFGIAHHAEPEHFTTGLEVDRWVRAKDGWYLGISCKRTLRERWKQAYTTDIGLLNRHKIKALWHTLVYDKDLSDAKLTEMGSHRAVFYLPDDSPQYQSAKDHPGMKDYVRPMSKFVDDLLRETGNDLEV